MPILDATAGQHLLQSLIHGLAHDKIRHIAMPIPAALKRMTASMLLTVITEAALKSPVSRISRSSQGWISPVAGSGKNALVRRQFRWRAGNAVFRQIGRTGAEHKTKAPSFLAIKRESANSPLRIATSNPSSIRLTSRSLKSRSSSTCG
jgi:hypothetical protein